MFGGKQNLGFQGLCGRRSKGPRPVMDRRQDRREGRHDRREVRRGGTPTTDATKKTEGAKATEDEKQ